MITPIPLLAALFGVGTATAAPSESPEPLAISFMTQFYNVPAEAVKVTIIEQKRFEVTVKAEASGHICTFDAMKVPAESKAQYGWAASSMQCDQRADHPAEEA